MTKPVFGVAASDEEWAASYSEAVARGGMEPLLLLPDNPELVREAISSVDGLLFTGGADIDPRHYNREPDPAAGLDEPNHAQDRWEIALLEAALEEGMPVLGHLPGNAASQRGLWGYANPGPSGPSGGKRPGSRLSTGCTYPPAASLPPYSAPVASCR